MLRRANKLLFEPIFQQFASVVPQGQEVGRTQKEKASRPVGDDRSVAPASKDALPVVTGS
jgi:hypothetical protein